VREELLVRYQAAVLDDQAGLHGGVRASSPSSACCPWAIA
jgi:hypothetical protein